MSYATDERLKSYLDTNQLHREQLCLAVLSLDKRFTNVRPRHPRGGPDGGRDIEATYRGEELAFGAVGFVNQAVDVEEKKRVIRTKFSEDLDSASGASPRASVLVFFTNVNFTAGEKQQLTEMAHARGIATCEIWDRERLRIALDSPDGFAARFQYLGEPMSEAEQASFFAKWGDEINSVIATGFQQVHATLSQLLFLQEANRPLHGFHVVLKLDREYPGKDISHFRAFCSVYLREPKVGILALLFGRTDKANRFRTDMDGRRDPSGIQNGVASGQWVVPWPTEDEPASVSEGAATQEAGSEDEEVLSRRQTGGGSAIGEKAVKQIVCSYTTPSFIRYEPVLSLMDFDDCMLLPLVSGSLAEKISTISVFANGYLLIEIPRTRFEIDRTEFTPDLTEYFDESELQDPWVRIRPSDGSSSFRLSFADEVPARMFKSKHATKTEVT